MSNRGDCYLTAANFMMDLGIAMDGAEGYTLVHGIVTGQGKVSGVKFGHAWVERGTGKRALVIDTSNDNDIRMPAFLYYAIGQIEVTVRYSWEQARALLLETGHYGPWDEQIKKAFHID